MTKTLLGLAIAGLGLGLAFVTNLIDAHNAVACYVALPAGAIFLGLFLISLMLEKESARFDSEQRTLHDAALEAEAGRPTPPAAAPAKERPSLVSADSH